MKILIDECIPRKLKRNLPGHDCVTVPEAGLAGKENGELLLLAQQRGFEVFLTIDKGFEYEQNLSGMSIAVMIVRAASNRIDDLVPHIPGCLASLRSIKAGQLVRVGR
jgi:predicted nuclease of predicted toxin-antitoxin system